VSLSRWQLPQFKLVAFRVDHPSKDAQVRLLPGAQVSHFAGVALPRPNPK